MNKILETTLHYVVISILLVGFFVFGQKVIAPWIANAVTDKLERAVKPVKVSL